MADGFGRGVAGSDCFGQVRERFFRVPHHPFGREGQRQRRGRAPERVRAVPRREDRRRDRASPARRRLPFRVAEVGCERSFQPGRDRSSYSPCSTFSAPMRPKQTCALRRKIEVRDHRDGIRVVLGWLCRIREDACSSLRRWQSARARMHISAATTRQTATRFEDRHRFAIAIDAVVTDRLRRAAPTDIAACRRTGETSPRRTRAQADTASSNRSISQYSVARTYCTIARSNGSTWSSDSNASSARSSASSASLKRPR